MNSNYVNSANHKVIKGRVIPATELEKKLEKSYASYKINRFKEWLGQRVEMCSPYKSCFPKSKKTLSADKQDASISTKFERQNEKFKRILNCNQKSVVYCVEQPTISNFDKALDFMQTDIDSNKPDDIASDIGFELDVNNTLKRTTTHTDLTYQQKSHSNNDMALNESDKPKITFSNLFGDLNNFEHDSSFGCSESVTSHDSSLDSRLSYTSNDDDNCSGSNYETFYEKVIIYEYITYF